MAFMSAFSLMVSTHLGVDLLYDGSALTCIHISRFKGIILWRGLPLPNGSWDRHFNLYAREDRTFVYLHRLSHIIFEP
jgi:hypothetical protein